MPRPRARQATVRPRLPRRVPRVSRQEQRDEAAFSAVANQQRLLDANAGRDTRDERFQGQITLGMGKVLERLDQLAQNVGQLAQHVEQQAQSMDRIADNIQEGVLSMQQNAAFMREVILLLSSHALRQPQPQAQPQPQPQPQPQAEPQAEPQAQHLAQPPEDHNN
ncbi:pleckstrin homology-like domain family A member 1 [Ixodes scapularis]|uniref:pleckstrin homology-like domain family A member 1 n=1 Tax=Ixodes scapularis TaxID=6945 RepID=UPI001A9FE403|nr:pleckstrin homology-like domain family A member 1 [Ixodes scapularis]